MQSLHLAFILSSWSSHPMAHPYLGRRRRDWGVSRVGLDLCCYRHAPHIAVGPIRTLCYPLCLHNISGQLQRRHPFSHHATSEPSVCCPPSHTPSLLRPDLGKRKKRMRHLGKLHGWLLRDQGSKKPQTYMQVYWRAACRRFGLVGWHDLLVTRATRQHLLGQTGEAPSLCRTRRRAHAVNLQPSRSWG